MRLSTAVGALLLLVSASVFAQDTGSIPNRVFVDIDLMGFFPTQDVVTTSRTAVVAVSQIPRVVTQRTDVAAYPALSKWWTAMPSVKLLFGHNVGIGGRVLRATYTGTTDLTATIPTWTTRSGDVYQRNDWLIDVNVAYVRTARQSRLTVFAGPSYFHSAHELISSVTSSPVIAGRLPIVRPTHTPVSGSGFGANVGGDAAYYPWRHVGVGGGLTYTYGKVALDDPLTDQKLDFDLGSATLNGGIRFRF